MALQVDDTEAFQELKRILDMCREEPATTCCIQATVDATLRGNFCLTYRYILFTALVAKMVDEQVDILSLQASDESDGAYDARSLCSKVIVPFQREFLFNALDGSNSDPLVNKPGRYLRLSKKNAAANGDPKRVLGLLCEDLPKVDTSAKARECVSYLVSTLFASGESERGRKGRFAQSTASIEFDRARTIIDTLLDEGFGGAALVIVTVALYNILYPADDGYSVVAHPVNQSGRSSHQISDVDVYLGDAPILATELKDKQFKKSDVDNAVRVAAQQHSITGFLFVGGRRSNIHGQSKAYFDSVRSQWITRGLYVGVIPIDALVDFVFATREIDVQALLENLRSCAEAIGNIEALTWVYKNVG